MPKTLNKISEALEERSMVYVRPSIDMLEKLEVTLHIWNKWLRKKLDPELWQLEVIADFLKCDIADLLTKREKVTTL